MIDSATFWIVLALSVPVYWLLPQRIRTGFLTLVSLAYLATLDVVSVVAVGVLSALFYHLAPLTRRLDRGSRLLWLLVTGVVAFLVAFKYLPALVEGAVGDGLVGAMILPLGISYYTFKLIHYVAEVARGGIGEHSLAQFASYMLLHPIFSAGPIERFDHFLANAETEWRSDSLVYALRRLVNGLIKKFAFADLVAERFHLETLTGEAFFLGLADMSVGDAWLRVAATYLFIYLDFSAYTDLAIGSSRLYGIRIMENFNFPVVADSIREYWRRWHMSLSGWCQSYIYLPVIGLWRQPLIALYATFLVMGLWHAASVERVAWGVYHATGVALFTVWQRATRRWGWRADHPLRRTLAILLTQAFVCGSMTFLIADPHGGLYGALRLLLKLVAIELPT